MEHYICIYGTIPFSLIYVVVIVLQGIRP